MKNDDDLAAERLPPPPEGDTFTLDDVLRALGHDPDTIPREERQRLDDVLAAELYAEPQPEAPDAEPEPGAVDRAEEEPALVLDEDLEV